MDTKITLRYQDEKPLGPLSFKEAEFKSPLNIGMTMIRGFVKLPWRGKPYSVRICIQIQGFEYSISAKPFMYHEIIKRIEKEAKCTECNAYLCGCPEYKEQKDLVIGLGKKVCAKVKYIRDREYDDEDELRDRGP